jgi:hypothetical protein
VIVTVVLDAMLAPAAGEAIVEVGGVVSVEAVAATRPDCRVAGWTRISANRLTVACCILASGERTARPQDHCTVPAPNTRAPLGAR